MESNNKQENSIRHMLSILNAARPYLTEEVSSSIVVLSKAQDLFASFPQKRTKNAPLHAMEAPGDAKDGRCPKGSPLREHNLEQMLNDVKKVCYPSEQASINTILSMIQARRLYQSYQNFQNSSSAGSSPSMMDFLKKQLSPEQAQLFQMMQSEMASS